MNGQDDIDAFGNGCLAMAICLAVVVAAWGAGAWWLWQHAWRVMP